MAMVSTCMTSLGLFFGALLSSMESFQLISNFVVWPLFFFSGALFPVKNLPAWLSTVTSFDPLTYGVEALRTILLGTQGIPLATCVTALVFSCLVTMAMGAWAFNRMEQI
ncbi:MAG: ABC transporter permease [Candidatus Micrarchaeota archaeon]|nr:ABC transporter permease [Candidatus Micrarchaeota archaeon]